MIGQDIWQRIFTGRTEKIVRTGTIVAGLYCMLYGVAGALIGAAAKVVVPRLESPDEAFAAVTEAVLPIGITGLVLAAALAAIMSTASAALLASSTIVANDLLTLVRKVSNPMIATRITTFVIGVAVVGVSLVLNDVVGALTVAYDLLDRRAVRADRARAAVGARHRAGRGVVDGGLVGGDHRAAVHQRPVLERPDHLRPAHEPRRVRRPLAGPGPPRGAGGGGDGMTTRLTHHRPPEASAGPRFTGPRTFMRLPHVETTEDVDVAVVGVPTDDAVSFRSGARFGPEAVRSASALLRPVQPAASSVDVVEHALDGRLRRRADRARATTRRRSRGSRSTSRRCTRPA